MPNDIKFKDNKQEQLVVKWFLVQNRNKYAKDGVVDWMRLSPHRLKYMNTWCSVGISVWISQAVVAVLEEVCR